MLEICSEWSFRLGRLFLLGGAMPRHERGPWFELENPHQLLEKLRSDLKRIHDNQLDSFAAFDFFVTAHHLLDWVSPDQEEGDRKRWRDGVRKTAPLMKLTARLAEGSKHHMKKSPTGRRGGFSFEFSDEFVKARIVVLLPDPKLAEALGKKEEKEISVYELGQKVIAEWEQRLGPPPPAAPTE
jgi:hypothetical protein